MRAVTDTLASYREAHRLIWKGRIWPVLIVPVFLTMIYLPAMIVGGIFLSDALTTALVEWLPALGEETAWVYWPMRVLTFLIFALLGWFTFRIVVMLLYVPFLDLVMERVEKNHLGHASDDPKRWYQMLGRIGLVAFVTLSLTLGLSLLSLAASFVPVVGTLIAMGCVLPLQFFLTGFGYLDPYFDRNGYRVGESLGLLGRRFPTVVAFEAVGSSLLLVPVIGWFLGPTYSVVAGVVLALRLEEGEGNPQKRES